MDPLLAVGPLAWIALAATGRVDGFGLSAAFALLVAAPIALAIDRGVPRWLRRTAAVAGIVASVSLALPAGPLAAAVGATWMVVALPHLAYGFRRFVAAPCKRHAHVWAEAMSAVGPVVGGAALISSRAGLGFGGFPEPLATLTVTHFHFTFGLLPITLAALTRAGFGPAGPLWGVTLLAPVIGALFTARPTPFVPLAPEVAAVAGFAVALGAWSAVAWPRLATLPLAARWIARLALLGLTWATALGARFSISWHVGENLPIDGMLRTHGVVNALATVALGAVALRVAPFSGRAKGASGRAPGRNGA